MQELVSGLSRSTSIKAFIIGFLTLVLLIPLSMIQGVISDRDQIGHEARWEIQRTWGEPQFIAGPVLVIPYNIVHTTTRGDEILTPRTLYVLPESLDVDGDVQPEMRYRGIFKVPVYAAQLTLRGSFSSSWRDDIKLADEHIDWQGAFVALGVSDGRAITEIPDIRFGSQAVRFESGGHQIPGFPPQIVAAVGKKVKGERFREDIPFEIDLRVNGSESLRFLPAGDTTNVTLRSSWSSPSFSGNYLPESREISEEGFTASWRVSSIGRALPSMWTDSSGISITTGESEFGVDFYNAISVYRLTERATKYGVLFIGLTFVAYFLFEIVAGARLHPLQYLLVGFANSLFYLLLLSLAEHIGFGVAYMLSSVASCTLIIGYSLSVLGDRQRSAIMAVILLLLYSFLYMTLKAESYAMLTGAIGLWVSLGVTMYLTRRIDWYGKPDVPS